MWTEDLHCFGVLSRKLHFSCITALFYEMCATAINLWALHFSCITALFYEMCATAINLSAMWVLPVFCIYVPLSKLCSDKLFSISGVVKLSMSSENIMVTQYCLYWMKNLFIMMCIWYCCCVLIAHAAQFSWNLGNFVLDLALWCCLFHARTLHIKIRFGYILSEYV